MKMIRVILMSLFLTGLYWISPVMAEEIPAVENSGQRSRSWNEAMEKKIQEIHNQLNLTDGQKKLLDENKTRDKQMRKARWEKVRFVRDSLNKELMKPDLNMAKIQEIHAQYKVLQAKMADERLESMLSVRKILTPEQFEKFIKLLDKSRRDNKHEEEHK